MPWSGEPCSGKFPGRSCPRNLYQDLQLPSGCQGLQESSADRETSVINMEQTLSPLPGQTGPGQAEEALLRAKGRTPLTFPFLRFYLLIQYRCFPFQLLGGLQIFLQAQMSLCWFKKHWPGMLPRGRMKTKLQYPGYAEAKDHRQYLVFSL